MESKKPKPVSLTCRCHMAAVVAWSTTRFRDLQILAVIMPMTASEICIFCSIASTYFVGKPLLNGIKFRHQNLERFFYNKRHFMDQTILLDAASCLHGTSWGVYCWSTTAIFYIFQNLNSSHISALLEAVLCPFKNFIWLSHQQIEMRWQFLFSLVMNNFTLK